MRLPASVRLFLVLLALIALQVFVTRAISAVDIISARLDAEELNEQADELDDQLNECLFYGSHAHCASAPLHI
jgi:hypothetical protein